MAAELTVGNRVDASALFCLSLHTRAATAAHRLELVERRCSRMAVPEEDLNETGAAQLSPLCQRPSSGRTREDVTARARPYSLADPASSFAGGARDGTGAGRNGCGGARRVGAT